MTALNLKLLQYPIKMRLHTRESVCTFRIRKRDLLKLRSSATALENQLHSLSCYDCGPATRYGSRKPTRPILFASAAKGLLLYQLHKSDAPLNASTRGQLASSTLVNHQRYWLLTKRRITSMPPQRSLMVSYLFGCVRPGAHFGPPFAFRKFDHDT